MLRPIFKLRNSVASRAFSTAAPGCPFHTNKAAAMAHSWWPDNLNLKPLGQGDLKPQYYAEYSRLFNELDLNEVRNDVSSLMTTSQDWWPADYGHYGPFFIRMAWHAAGTYRVYDGRGGSGTGQLRYAPLNSFPDNANLDKARRLLWPIKKKYGKRLSWADLMIFAGNCAYESMGLKMFGFGGGRIDTWEPESDVYWGPEEEWLEGDRGGIGEDLDQPLAAVQMGLIYVNPQGPGGHPDILQSAKDIRTTFGRMAMNDYETVALIAGGHTVGKAHGAGDADKHVGVEPEGNSKLEEQGFGWTSSHGSGKGADAITSGLEGAWTSNPIKWDNGYFENLFKYEWEQTTSPAGAIQWRPTDRDADGMVADAHDPSQHHHPIMFTTDLALREDPEYRAISEKFLQNPEEFSEAFSKAWYKLTHRDLGHAGRLLGVEVPPPQIWQDPRPKPDSTKLVTAGDIEKLKKEIIDDSGLSRSQLVRTAWASASTYRCTDLRGGSHDGRIRLAPQNEWPVNEPEQLNLLLSKLEEIQQRFNAKGGAEISMADMIVLGGNAAVEAAAKDAGHKISVPFTPGRTDASTEETDAASFDVLEPSADGFRNYVNDNTPDHHLGAKHEALLVDRSFMLGLNKLEMTALVGGLRVLGANVGGSEVGVLTDRVGKLTNDFFINLLDMDTEWQPAVDGLYRGVDRSSGETKWTASRVDLIFGSNSELRAVAEHYAADDAESSFVNDFVSAWDKVMELGR